MFPTIQYKSSRTGTHRSRWKQKGIAISATVVAGLEMRIWFGRYGYWTGVGFLSKNNAKMFLKTEHKL